MALHMNNVVYLLLLRSPDRCEPCCAKYAPDHVSVNHVGHLSSHRLEFRCSTPPFISSSSHIAASSWALSNAHSRVAREHLIWHLGNGVNLVGKSGTQLSFHLHQVENIFHPDAISSTAFVPELGQVLFISDAVPPALQALNVSWWVVFRQSFHVARASTPS